MRKVSFHDIVVGNYGTECIWCLEEVNIDAIDNQDCKIVHKKNKYLIKCHCGYVMDFGMDKDSEVFELTHEKKSIVDHDITFDKEELVVRVKTTRDLEWVRIDDRFCRQTKPRF